MPAREAGLLPAFPFGTDFTETEQRLIPALQEASAKPTKLLGLAWQRLTATTAPPDANACLARMSLARPSAMSERLYRLLLRAALARTGLS